MEYGSPFNINLDYIGTSKSKLATTSAQPKNPTNEPIVVSFEVNSLCLNTR